MHVVFEAPPEEKEPGRRNRGSRKTYSFGFELLSYVLAPGPLAQGEKTKRPVFLVAAASDEEYGPVRANLQLGRKFGVPASRMGTWDDQFELLRSQPYAFETQKVEGATLVSVYHESLRPDPGWVDPDGITFVCLPSVPWCERVRATISPGLDAKLHAMALRIFSEIEAHYPLSDLVEVAPLFAAYLDRRTRIPLVPDLKFQVALLAACLKHGLATTPGSRYVTAKHVEKVQHRWPIVMHAEHGAFNQWAATVAQNFYAGRL